MSRSANTRGRGGRGAHLPDRELSSTPGGRGAGISPKPPGFNPYDPHSVSTPTHSPFNSADQPTTTQPQAKVTRVPITAAEPDLRQAGSLLRCKAELEKVQKELESQKKTEHELRKFLKNVLYHDIGSGEYSDFKVKCFEKTFNLHRIVVCPQSMYFTAALEPGNFEEGSTRLISLPEDDPRIFAKLVQLLYIRELEEGSSTTVLDLVKLYVMADKYRCEDAVEMARKLATPALRVTLADQCDNLIATPQDPTPQDAKNNNWDSYTESISFLYMNIPSDNDRLKRETAQEAACAWKFLRRSEKHISAFLKEVPDFAIALASNRFLFGIKERKGSGVEEVKKLMEKASDLLRSVREKETIVEDF